ncbi:hypothetical protein ACLMAL_39135 [Nocardia sp. CWNU-33]|uniref:hypothetical protein n=1 Tax=Nocardia sp. CWNU-33 TaxID=3392117 RepID=UPI00398F5CF3
MGLAGDSYPIERDRLAAESVTKPDPHTLTTTMRGDHDAIGLAARGGVRAIERGGI